MDQLLNNDSLFEDETVEDELSKLEAEIEQVGHRDNRMVSTAPQKRTGKKSEAVELDKEEFLIEYGDDEEAAMPKASGSTPEVDHSSISVTSTSWHSNKNIICIFIIALIIILSFAIYILNGKSLELDTGKLKEQEFSMYGSVRKRIGPKVCLPHPLLGLSSFIIPIEKDSDNAYLFLSISVMSPNSTIYEEINIKRAFLRGILYDLLKKIINDGKVIIVPCEAIKLELLKALNTHLNSGKIEKVYFTDFLLM